MEPSLLRRYRWSELSDAEKDAINDTVSVAATRAGIGLGVVLTSAALISNARRAKPPLPPFVRYGSLLFFSAAGSYIGFLTGGPTYVQRILSVPNSRLADDLRTVMGDWSTRSPAAMQHDAQPHEPLPKGETGTFAPEIPPDPRQLRRRDREGNADQKQ